MSPIERPCITDEPMGLPSPEALQMATDVIRRRYVLPETMERPEVRSECMRLVTTPGTSISTSFRFRGGRL